VAEKEAEKGGASLRILKIIHQKLSFCKKRIPNPAMKRYGKTHGEAKFFSHGTKHSKGVCILIYSSMRSKTDYVFSSNSGRLVLTAMEFNSLKLSLCNVYVPNSQPEQLNFLQELNNLLIDNSELSTLIIGGDWNYTLTKSMKWAASFGNRETIEICF